MLLVALAVLALAAFAITRAARAGDDLVNTVELSPRLEPAARREVAFTLAEADGSVDVLIIDGNPGSDDEQVRALAIGADLPAGPQAFDWDGTTDDGEPAPPGTLRASRDPRRGRSRHPAAGPDRGPRGRP